MVTKIKILQADADVTFRRQVQEYFQLLDDVKYFDGGERAENIFTCLEKYEPNVILLDLHLPPLGGLAILEQIRTQWKKSVKVLIVSCCSQPEATLAEAARLGADYFILRPIDLVVLEQRIRQLVLEDGPIKIELTLKAVQDICKYYFDLIGIPPHYKGYRYLIEGVWLAALHPDWLNSVTKKLYPVIGQRFGTSGFLVERTMRYAIDATWEKGNLDELYRLFPYESSEQRGKPTNSAFIAKMVDLVNLEIGFKG